MDRLLSRQEIVPHLFDLVQDPPQVQSPDPDNPIDIETVRAIQDHARLTARSHDMDMRRTMVVDEDDEPEAKGPVNRD